MKFLPFLLGSAGLAAAAESLSQGNLRNLASEPTLEGNAFQVLSEYKRNSDGPHHQKAISLTISRDGKPFRLTEAFSKEATEDGKTKLYMAPFFMNHIPISDLLRPFRGEHKIFERDFAEALSSLVKELTKENIFVQSILAPSKEAKTKLIFHDLIEMLSLKTSPKEDDSEKTLLRRLKDGFTRIEWFYLDRANLGFDVLQSALEKAEQLIGDMKSPFWRSTSFGRKMLSIQERILSTFNQINTNINDNLLSLRGNLQSNLRGGLIGTADNIKGNVSSLANDIVSMNRNFNNDLTDIRHNIHSDINAINHNLHEDLHEIKDNLTQKIGTINTAVNSDIHAINENISGRIETFNNSLNGDLNEINRSIKGKIAATNNAVSTDIDGGKRLANKQYGYLGKVLRNEIETLDGKVHNTIESINSSVNQKFDDGIENINSTVSNNLRTDGKNLISFILTPKFPFKVFAITESEARKIEEINFTHTLQDDEDERRFRLPLLHFGQRPAAMRSLDASKEDWVFSNPPAGVAAPTRPFSASREKLSTTPGSPDPVNTTTSSPEEPTESTTTTTPTTTVTTPTTITTTTTTTTTTHPCVEENMDYFGHDIVKMEDSSVISCSECQAFCQANPECHFWTFNVTERWCYLKGEKALEGRTYQPDGFKLVSGSKNCKFEENIYPKAPCNAEGVDLLGFDIEKIEGSNTGITGVEDCLTACKANPRCFYFTFDTKSNSCYLKDREAMQGWTHGHETLHFISGSKRCLS